MTARRHRLILVISLGPLRSYLSARNDNICPYEIIRLLISSRFHGNSRVSPCASDGGRNKARAIDRRRAIRKTRVGQRVSQVYSSMENVSPAVCTAEGGYRSYLRSNGVQLPTLLINPPPRRSTARSIVSRFHSQPHRRPSVRQRYLRGISPPAYYILHYRPRPSESRSVYTRGNHSASLDSILHSTNGDNLAR